MTGFSGSDVASSWAYPILIPHDIFLRTEKQPEAGSLKGGLLGCSAGVKTKGWW